MTSKYQIIIKDITEGIEQQRFKRGEKLPSIRSLSQQYQCSKDTVQKALLELKYQNKIYAVEKSGYYILEDTDFRAEQVAFDPKDFQELPYEDFRICVNESLVGRENYLFNYYHQQAGLEELIQSVGQLLVHYDVYAKKEQIVITAGSQQALYILSQMDFPEERRYILLERPTYHRMQHLVEEQGLPYQTIERTMAGINLTELERLFASGTIRFFYTIPRLHYPLGTSYTMEEKKAIVDLAQRYGVYIVEDDYLADFDEDKQVPLHYLDTENRVIYIKSFTTTLFPALRIGSVVLPPHLVTHFLRHKSLIDYDTNLIMQKALSLYIDNGMFARNTKHLQQANRQKRAEMEQIMWQLPFQIPYQIAKEEIVFELTGQQLTPRIKHSQLPFKLTEGNKCSFLRFPFSVDMKSILSDFQSLL